MNKCIILSFLFTMSFLSFADTNHVLIAMDTTEYFSKKVIPSCITLDPFNYLSMYYQDYVRDLRDNGYRSEENYYLSKVESYLKQYQCDQEKILQFKKLINRDMLPVYREVLSYLKQEIQSVRSKKLSASAQITKYLAYKDHYLPIDLPLDPEIAALVLEMNNNKEKQKEKCTDVMNLKEPLSIDKPKNQDTVGWCYAYTASDLIAHATGKNPSAVHAALLFNDTFWSKLKGLKEGGYINVALSEMISEGICLEKDMPSNNYHFSLYGYDLGNIFKQVLELRKNYQEHQITAKEIKNDLCSKNKYIVGDLKQIFPGLAPDDLAIILSKGSSNTAFKRIADKTCPVIRDDNLKALSVITETKDEAMFTVLDQQLSKGNIVGIDYASSVLHNYKVEQEHANHASSIVGRRFNAQSNSCEYLIRNSNGIDCSSYSAEYECHSGHIWIGEDYLKFNRAIKKVTYVQKK